MANVASLAEVKAAQAFLRVLGAPWQNNNLIAGVVAWMRQESGSLARVIGNNPFNLRPGSDVDGSLVAGIRRSTAGNGYFIVFKSLEAGLMGTAQRLLRAGSDWRNYDEIVRAARRGDVPDFLNSIAISAWDAAHYGWPNTNHLIRVYNSLTGLQLPAPKPPPGAARPKPRTKPPVTKPPSAPKSPPASPPVPPKPPERVRLEPPVPEKNYIDPFATGSFYSERHQKTNVLDD